MQVRAVALLGGAGDGVVDELARGGGGLEGDLLVGLAGLVPVVAELGGDLDLVVLGVDANGLGVGERRVLLCTNSDQNFGLKVELVGWFFTLREWRLVRLRGSLEN